MKFKKKIIQYRLFKKLSLIRSLFEGDIYFQMFPLPIKILLSQEDNSIHSDDKSNSDFLNWNFQKQLQII